MNTVKNLEDVKPVFVAPPEAPIFHPNEEEFKDPLAYIAKIRSIAEQIGICKIKPPSHWRPPFAVDVDKFKFTPRIQKLNELDAKIRIKLNFLEKIAKFWEMQGTTLKIPMIEGTALDLHTLYKTVHTQGGFVSVSKLEKWPTVSQLLGYKPEKATEALLKTHYERLLFPFDLFNSHRNNSNQQRNIKKCKLENTSFGMKIRSSPRKSQENFNCTSKNEREAKTQAKRKISYDLEERDPLEKYICYNCNKGDDEEYMLLCDGCDDGYHTFCLIPPLQDIPDGDWCCPKCVAEECSKPMDAFGFEQANREYSLQQFGEMADKFKADYFKMATHEVPTSTVEQEYWRIISSLEEDVTVEYGADLHAMDHGSGFPTSSSLNLFPGDKEYADSPWNLNNLPVLEGSVLRYISADVSGIKIPWMYVGMCFATFCWHIEDHWTYSINYLHWGEAKTWYAVPSSKAEQFETAMKTAAPELFRSQPDLLHQLVTIINPNVLMNSGVPVYRTDQHAGEFVITFPRAYHGGFNQGYNFAEAVNFAPADWLKIGRECVLHYSKLRRFCVFSHDELICNMASEPEKLIQNIATDCYLDMRVMVENEKRARKQFQDWGVKKFNRVIFEFKPDDERQCELCKTTCFLTAVTCKCSGNLFACLKHCRSLCECPAVDKTVKFRYTLDELLTMLKRLKLKSESFDEWVAKVNSIMDPKAPKTLYLADLKKLLNQAIMKNFPRSELFRNLSDAVKKAEKFASIIYQLNDYKERSGNSNDKQTKITIEELKVFVEEINSLPCLLEETKFIEEMFHQATIFEKTSNLLLSVPLFPNQFENLQNCRQFGVSIGVELPNLKEIVSRIEQLQWLQDVQKFKTLAHVMTIENIKNLIQVGSGLKSNPFLDQELSVLQELLKQSKAWEKKAINVLCSKNNNVLLNAERLFQEASDITCFLPTEGILYDAVQKARNWLRLFEETNLSQPHVVTVEDLVKKGKKLTLHLVEVQKMEKKLELANTWKEKVRRLFLHENATYSLLQALTPKTINTNFFENFPDTIDIAAIVAEFKEAENTEIHMIRNIRESNLCKSMDFYSFTFCVCAKGPYDIMKQCQLCKDWFHSTCINLIEHEMNDPKPEDLLHFNSGNPKFLCPKCKRTKRPDKDAVFSMLLALRDLYIRIPEGEILQCIAERALNWQARAKKILEELQQNSLWDGQNFTLSIDSTMRARIDEIAMEGDLIEITIVECGTLWNLVQAMEQLDEKPKIIDFNSYLRPVCQIVNVESITTQNDIEDCNIFDENILEENIIDISSNENDVDGISVDGISIDGYGIIDDSNDLVDDVDNINNISVDLENEILGIPFSDFDFGEENFELEMNSS